MENLPADRSELLLGLLVSDRVVEVFFAPHRSFPWVVVVIWVLGVSHIRWTRLSFLVVFHLLFSSLLLLSLSLVCDLPEEDLLLLCLDSHFVVLVVFVVGEATQEALLWDQVVGLLFFLSKSG